MLFAVFFYSIYDIEKKIKTAEKFRYPHFETVNWFAAKRLLQEINEINVEERRCPETLLVGIKALLSSLKHWNTEKDVCCLIMLTGLFKLRCL